MWHMVLYCNNKIQTHLHALADLTQYHMVHERELSLDNYNLESPFSLMHQYLTKLAFFAFYMDKDEKITCVNGNVSFFAGKRLQNS